MDNKLIIGMIILNDKKSFNIAAFKKIIIEEFNYTIEQESGDNNAFVLTIKSEEIWCSFMDFPIPWSDIKGTAKYN